MVRNPSMERTIDIMGRLSQECSWNLQFDVDSMFMTKVFQENLKGLSPKSPLFFKIRSNLR